METKFMRISLSIIGNCAEFLKNNGQELRNIFSGYEISSKDEKLPDGTTVKSLLFTDKNVNVKFTPQRVDCTVSAPAVTTPVKDCFVLACDVFEKLKVFNSQLIGNRIAIVAQGFIENQQNKAIEEFTKKMNFTKAFGPCNELSFKINNPVNSFEPLNNVLNIEMGEAKNNKTGEVIKVLLVNIDVNTLAANKTERFTPANVKPLFTDILKIAEAKLQALRKY